MHFKQLLPAGLLGAMIAISATIIVEARTDAMTAQIIARPTAAITHAADAAHNFAGRITLPSRFQETPENRTAKRLQQRIQNRFGFAPGIADLRRDITRQRSLFSNPVTLTFVTDDGSVIPEQVIRADQFPKITVSPGGVRTDVDADAVRRSLSELSAEVIRTPVHATLLSSVLNKEGILKAEMDGVAKAGNDFSAESVTQAVMDAFSGDERAVKITLNTVPGRIVNATGEDLGSLVLLATGRSNFEGSGGGRKANVRKGLNTYITNIIVPAGEEFSINKILGNVPIHEWEMALGIFNGRDLRPVAGGGLCQVATTLYRGILNAGLPVTKRYNHSLFVHYYEKHGVGIDATIFPSAGVDLRFMNDTGNAILIQSYTEGDEAIVSMYGTPDGRKVQMTGPYFTDNAPEGFAIDGNPLKRNQIAWVRDVTYADGRTDRYTVLSRYNSIPKSVVKEYVGTLATVTTSLMHASAPDEKRVP